jgi:hypothetical protein
LLCGGGLGVGLRARLTRSLEVECHRGKIIAKLECSVH